MGALFVTLAVCSSINKESIMQKPINFTPFTQAEIDHIMAQRHIIPERKQLVTSGGIKVYMMTQGR